MLFLFLEMYEENYKIDTAQNVDIEFPVASVAERILATLIDYFIFFLYFMFAMMLISALGIGSEAIFFLMLLPLLLYDLVLEIVLNGRSIGKLLLGIRVVRLDGSAPTLSGYLIRWIFRIVDSTICLGSVAMITIIINGKGQRLGDIAAGTAVIKNRKKNQLDPFLMNALQNNHKVVFENATILSESEIATIREVIDFYLKFPSKKSEELLYKTKQKIENKLKVNTQWDAYHFLNTVLNDYTILSTQNTKL